METRFLESFVAVADYGSMAEAARRLAVTPAAVAQRIQALESELGVRLLVRVGRTVRPTEAGTMILTRGRAMLREVKELRALSADGGLVGELRVGSISTALTGILPATLKRLIQAAPRLELYVEPGTSVVLYQRVTEGELDAAVLVRPTFALPKTCEWLLVRSEPLVLLASSAAVVHDPHTLLRREPFIRYDRNHWGGRLADTYLRRARIQPWERMELDALDAIAVMVSEGLGVSLVPGWAPPWPQGLSINRLALPNEAPVRHIGLLWRRGSPRQRMIEAFKEAMVEPAVSVQDHDSRGEQLAASGTVA